jgi:osmotically-inducible protein OsmY
MESDLKLNEAVLAELESEPSVNLEDIRISVRDGVVTLTGSVSNCAEKLAAGRAAKRVAGLRGLAEDIVVKLPESSRRADTDIAAAAVDALKWMTSLPADGVRVTVRDGWLSLEGAVGGWQQKRVAQEAVGNLAGLKGVTNLILIEPAAATVDVKGTIEAAFKRHALLHARQVQVDHKRGKVVLRGNVRSFIEREEAERAAWAAAGVTDVENRIVLLS